MEEEEEEEEEEEAGLTSTLKMVIVYSSEMFVPT